MLTHVVSEILKKCDFLLVFFQVVRECTASFFLSLASDVLKIPVDGTNTSKSEKRYKHSKIKDLSLAEMI